MWFVSKATNYKVCKAGQTDSCINPQDAGFDWGGKEIDYWPGKPASEIEGKLPENKPADLASGQTELGSQPQEVRAAPCRCRAPRRAGSPLSRSFRGSRFRR